MICVAGLATFEKSGDLKILGAYIERGFYLLYEQLVPTKQNQMFVQNLVAHFVNLPHILGISF